jgi:hypothetical protein
VIFATDPINASVALGQWDADAPLAHDAIFGDGSVAGAPILDRVREFDLDRRVDTISIPSEVPVKSNDNVTESGWFYQMIMLPECPPPFLSLVV